MHIKTYQAHLDALGKDEGSSLQSANGSGHVYGSPIYQLNEETVYHN